MRLGGLFLVGLALVAFLVVATVAAILGSVAEILTFHDPAHATACASTTACELAYAATTLANHLDGAKENDYPHRPDATPIDPFLRPIWEYWKQVCGGYVCSDMQPGNVQCVEFVKGALFLAHQPVTDHPDAIDWWYHYANKKGWMEIPSAALPGYAGPATRFDQRGTPEPGDIVIWDGSDANVPAGHIAIVIGVELPLSDKDGWVEVAQGNGPGNRFPGTDWPGNFYKMPLHPDLTVGTWPGYRVMGYLREMTPRSRAPTNLAKSQYVATAVSDASAIGIPPAYFTEQIQVESGYNPKARSPAGAEGIAQFLPGTAAGLGIDPWNPPQALQAASKLMAAYTTSWGGDYAAALAQYNAGEGQVTPCKAGHDPAWLACMGADVQHYVLAILFYPDAT